MLAIVVRWFKIFFSKCSVLAIAVRVVKSSSSSKCGVLAISVGGFQSSSSSKCCTVLAVRGLKRARGVFLRGDVLERLCVFLSDYRF